MAEQEGGERSLIEEQLRAYLLLGRPARDPLRSLKHCSEPNSRLLSAHIGFLDQTYPHPRAGH